MTREERMIVGDVELVLTTGDGGGKMPKPLVHAERADEAGVLTVEQIGGRLHFDGSWTLDRAQKRAARQMFLRYNSRLAEDAGLGLGRRFVRFPGDTITVCLVACSEKKREQACAAKDLYQSDLFVKSRRWAELFSDEWGVLSAKYGLVLPDQVIEPYDQRLGEVLRVDSFRARLKSESEEEYEAERAEYHRVTEPRRREWVGDCQICGWASRVSYQCYMQWGEDTHYILLAGKEYRRPFEDLNVRRLPALAPMSGLGIGEQKAWLNMELSGAPPPKGGSGRPAARKLKFK